jgi:glycosyltransferase involved in cell wall biosynthesis
LGFCFLCSVKVLLLHQHFKTPQTGGAIRSYYLAKALVDNGIEVIVITAHGQQRYQKKIIEGIEVHYLPVPYDNRFGFYQRGMSFLKYVWKSVGLVSRFNNVDLCYAISVPLTVGLAAMRIQSRFKIPFIFEVGDLWPEAPVQLGYIHNPVLKAVLFRLEKKIYQRAEAIVALSPSIKSSIESKIPRKPVHVITNMADTDFFKPAPKNSALEKKFGVDGKFVISYIGAIGVANGLDYYLECARACQRVGLPIHFILCGDGASLKGLRIFSQKLELKNISIIPFQDRDGVREILNVTDASFICYKPVPVLETGSPNKYFDSLAAGKLVLINFGGWIKEEIEREQCGVYIDRAHPTDIVNRIKPFLEDRLLLEKYQRASRTLAENKYSRSKLSSEFVELIKHS